MYQIQNFTDNPKQKQTLQLPDGTFIVISLYFIPMQQGWFIQNLSYGKFVLSGVRVTNSPNILHQYRNQIPFGLACFSTQDREPSLAQDFVTGASKLYILTKQECDQFTGLLSGKI
jgi:hypothetical protein